MQLIHRYRIPALFCALAVLVCELVSRPFTTIGIVDDGPYILIAQKLAATGHLVYNGPTTPMLGWQLYLGAGFIKLFGFSFTTVRMSTLLIAMALAFVLQRTLVRASISERNATLGTLALVLSPLYLMLSVTFMTDISGLFAVVLCLYGCLRALQSLTSRSAVAWLCFAVVTNALCGTSRQIAWLGILVMVPSTLWLLRSRRRVLLAGAAATLAGMFFIFACMHWFNQQPYNVHEPLLPATFPVVDTLRQLFHTLLDAPFLLLPIMALFLPEIRRSRPRVVALISGLSLLYTVLAIRDRHLKPDFMLMPTHADWVGLHGIFEYAHLQGTPPIFLHPGIRVLLTIVSIGGLLGLLASLLRSRISPATDSPAIDASTQLSWKQLGILLAPFALVYVLLLVPRASTADIYNRYLLELLTIALVCLVRYYQEQVQPRIPLASLIPIGIMAVYGVAATHNMFIFYRARATIAAELRAAGIPDTSVDNGWEYNFDVELQHADHTNDSRIVVPAHAYIPVPPPPAGACRMFRYDQTPHIHPLYSISFDPDACYGPAPFAPVHYSRWLAATPGTLYVVRYTRPAKP